MKHAAWFQLVLKGIGLVLIVIALTHLLPATIQYWQDERYERQMLMQGLAFGKSDHFRNYLFEAIPSVVQVAMGIYLLVAGRWIIRLCIPPGRRYCHCCGYDLSGNGDSSVCAECNEPLPTTSCDA